MKVQIAHRISHASHANILPSSERGPRPRFLRLSRNAFLVVGILALSYSGFVLLDTKLYQADQAHRFQEQVSGFRPASADAGDRAGPAADASALGVPLGKIEIPRLGLSAMILEGVDEKTLRLAVGHIPGTSLPGRQGNVAIAGHRDTFFRALRNIQPDDEITLSTLNGSYRYLVDSTQLVAPEDTQVLDDSGGSILTLVTCYPFYYVGPAPKRFIVHAHKIPG